YKSTDQGEHWAQYPTHVGIARCTYLSGLTGGLLVSDDGGRMYRTTNDGQKWDTIYTGPTIRSFGENPGDRSIYVFNIKGEFFHLPEGGSQVERLDSVWDPSEYFPIAIDPEGNLFSSSGVEGVLRLN